MKSSRFNLRKQQFKETFQDSEANYSESENPALNQRSTGKPIQLIRIQPNGKIDINNEALEIIASYNEPIGFASLVGKTRTGKSCLLNRLLNIKGNGFRVDSSITSCTEGIWMWSDPFQNKKYNNIIFFLDTEGTDSLVKNNDNDTKIFTLSVLISSFFIYNSVGSIDQRSLSELEMVTALSRKIKTGDDASTDATQLTRFMPRFLWLLRDFMLQIQDKHYRKITANTYLQNCLTDQNTNQQSKKIKRGITTYFPIRECLTLVRPVSDEELLYDLNSLQDHRLRREFIEGVNTLRNKIIDNTGPKIYAGKEITGYSMAVMIQNYVEAFNSGNVPNIKSAWEQIAADEGNEAYKGALEVYQALLQRELGDQQPRGQQIYKITQKLRTESLNKFREQVANNYKQHGQQLRKLQEFIDRSQQQILQQNDKLCQKHNYSLIESLSLNLRKRIENNYYANPDGKTQLSNDIEEIRKTYKSQAIGKSSEEILSKFWDAVNPAILNIQTQDPQAQSQLQRQKEIEAQENRRRLQLQAQQNESKMNQQATKDRTDTNKASNKMPRKETSKQLKPQQGCCAGRCQIM